ncbi:hypothetical protein LSAT2_003413 [Lamellibrachia satsuma]|nr:hypothetical protein LSAT2_003413 [Lamellibrachia satsuma]
MKACDISPKGWEAVAEDRTAWHQATHRGIERADEKKHQHAAEKRMRGKQNAALPPMSSCFVCFGCGKDGHSRIGLHSHKAEYSFRLRKDIIPLLLQPGYVPDGWLGLMVGTRLYFDFTTDESMTKEMPRLLREIGSRGKLAGAGSSCSDSFSSLNGLSSMLHNSLSTSSMHSYNRSQQVASWTPDDVQQWLTSCDLAVVADRLSDFTGELLLQYRKMLTDAPEYFYSSLERHLRFDLITILVFTKALQGLS